MGSGIKSKTPLRVKLFPIDVTGKPSDVPGKLGNDPERVHVGSLVKLGLGLGSGSGWSGTTTAELEPPNKQSNCCRFWKMVQEGA
jgi:hypothetical protein